MSGEDERGAGPAPGATTASSGTPFAVDVSADRPARVIWAAFLAGPIIFMVHFMIVYLVAEAACTGDGPGLAAFNSPVVEIVTVAATVVAALGCLAVARWNLRRWRARATTAGAASGWPFGDVDDDDGGGAVAFAGVLVATLSAATVILVGVGAPFLASC